MLYGKIKLDMALKTQFSSQSLEITGNVLELPPVKDITRAIEKKPQVETPKKRHSHFVSTSSISNTIRAPVMAPLTKRSDSNSTLSRQNSNENKELIKQLEVIIFYILYVYLINQNSKRFVYKNLY
jgi:hypothetical protein